MSSSRTRGRVIAIIIIIIAMYFAVKYSMLPPGEVEKIKDKVEQSDQQLPAVTETLATDDPVAATTDTRTTDPALAAFEQFVADLPRMAFITEIDRYFVPGVEAQFREQLATLGSDPLEVARGIFNLKDVEYQEVQADSDSHVRFSFTASNTMSRSLAGSETDSTNVWRYRITMALQHHAWLIQDVNFGPAEQP